MCKRINETFAIVLNLPLLAQLHLTQHKTNKLIHDAIITAMHDLFCMVSTILQLMPEGLIFFQEMFPYVTLVTSWQVIIAKSEQLVNDTLIHANEKPLTIGTRLV